MGPLTQAARDQRFAWQGFSLPISDAWRPAVLSGDHKRGYVRLDGERDDLIQVRWQRAKRAGNLNERVLAYFSRLEAGAKKRKTAFKGTLEPNGSAMDFEWHAGQKGYGRVWHDPETKRVYLVERSGRGGDSFKREARELIEAFEIHAAGPIPWSVLGLRLALPQELRLDTFNLLSGRTTLRFKSRRARLTAERWGFAEQIVQKHGLESWAKSATGLPIATEVSENRIELRAKPTLIQLLAKRVGTALVHYRPEENLILALHGRHHPDHPIEWEFLR